MARKNRDSCASVAGIDRFINPSTPAQQLLVMPPVGIEIEVELKADKRLDMHRHIAVKCDHRPRIGTVIDQGHVIAVT